MSFKSNQTILLIGNFLSKLTGTRSYCEDFSKNLINNNWDVITTSKKAGRWPRLFDMLATVWKKRKEYDVVNVDVFSGLSFIWAEAVCQLLVLLGKPIIITLRGGNLPVFTKRRPERVKRLLRSANVVTTPSNYLLDQMEDYCEFLQFIPNALEIENYNFQHRGSIEPKLVWLRAFHEIYNPTLAPKVINFLKDSFNDVTLLMIGPNKKDGSLQQVKKTAALLGVSNRLIIQGAVPKNQVPQWLSKGHIFLNTTNIDNMPVSVIEAMASGLPVISTNVGGIPYLLDHEQDALLVPPDDPEAMAQAVNRILTESGLAERLSSNARQKAEKYDWSVILPQWERLFEEVLETK